MRLLGNIVKQWYYSLSTSEQSVHRSTLRQTFYLRGPLPQCKNINGIKKWKKIYALSVEIMLIDRFRNALVRKSLEEEFEIGLQQYLALHSIQIGVKALVKSLPADVYGNSGIRIDRQ